MAEAREEPGQPQPLPHEVTDEPAPAHNIAPNQPDRTPEPALAPESPLRRALDLLLTDRARLVRALKRRILPPPRPLNWPEWKRRYARFDKAALNRLAAETAALPIRFTLLVAGDGKAVQTQVYPAEKIEIIPLNRAEIASDWGQLPVYGAGSHMCLLPAGVVLPPQALALVARFLASNQADMLYADSETLDTKGRPKALEPRCAFDPDLFYGLDQLGPVRIFARSALKAITRPVSSRADLVLALIENKAVIRHLPQVLAAHAPITADAIPAETLSAHLARLYPEPPRIEPGALPGSQALVWPLPAKRPRLSVIIPTRDHADDLSRCLAGLERSNWTDAEILVVDNRSTEPSARALLSQLANRPGFRVLSYEKAFNYSAINNWAVLHATGDLLLLLNNDATLIEPQSLIRMAGQAMRPGIGAVGARLLYPDGRLQHAGTLLGLGGVAGHWLAGSPGDAPGPMSRLRLTHRATAVTAAAMMLRRSLWHDAGGMDDVNLPVAFNDVDLCLRLASLGHASIVETGAVFAHAESVSRGRDSDPAVAARFQSEIKTMQRRWNSVLTSDPWHNPHLSLDHDDGRLAVLPRK